MNNFPPLLVLPRNNVRGFDGGNQQEIKSFPLIGFEDALKREYATDAHFTLYGVPGDDEHLPRLNKSSLDSLRSIDLEPYLNYLAIDVDNPEHSPWDAHHLLNFEYLYATTPLLRSAAVYATRHGWRAIWPLQRPVPASRADDYISQFVEHCRDDLDIDADPACTDWTRIFRLPRATRPGDDTPLEPLFVRMDDVQPLDWTAPASPPPRDSSAPAANNDDDDGTPPLTLDDVQQPLTSDDLDDLLTETIVDTDIRHHWIGHALADHIPPDLDYHEWIKIGMALKQHFNNDRRAFQLWDTWSSGSSDKYDGTEELLKKWRTFNVYQSDDHRNAVGIGTLKRLARKYDADVPETPAIDNERQKDRKTLSEQNAAELGVDVGDLDQHIILFDLPCRNFYVLDEEGTGYKGPYAGDALRYAIEQHAPQIMLGKHLNENGKLRARQQLLSRFGSPIRDVRMVLGEEYNHYNPRTKILRKGAAPVRSDLDAAYHEDIDQWLTLLGGDHADKLKDWLATFLDLQKTTCVLYIQGEHSVGKGLLAEGLARLWGSAPTPYDVLNSNFNEEITKCPLVVADESIPTGVYDTQTTSVFRRFVGSSQIQISRKYRPPATLVGAPRLLVTANNDDALKVRESLTRQDLEAIKLRIGYIEADSRARDFLRQLGGRRTTEAWVAGDKIAEHVLWLAQNREVEHGSRFVVDGWESPLVEGFAYQSDLTREAITNLIRYVEQGHDHKKIVLCDDETIKVHLSSFQNMWTTLSPQGNRADVPSQAQLSTIFKSLANGRGRLPPDDTGSRARVWEIPIEHLEKIADRYYTANPNEIRMKARNASNATFDDKDRPASFNTFSKRATS